MAVSGWSFFMRLLCWRFIRASVFFHFLLFLISLLHKPVFLSYRKRNMFFVLVQNMEKQPSMCVWSVLGFSVFSCYIFFPWITLSLSPYIYGRMICFLPSPCIYGFCYLTFFFFFGIKICYLKISRLLLGLFIVGLSTIFFAPFWPFWFFSLHLFYIWLECKSLLPRDGSLSFSLNSVY